MRSRSIRNLATFVFGLGFYSILVSCHKSSGTGSQGGSTSGTTGATLSISSISPTNGPDSTTVIIVGTGFSTTTTDDNVNFNGKAATVLTASLTQLSVRVPTLAGTGVVSATVNGTTCKGPNFTYDTSWRVNPFAGGFVRPQFLCADASGNLYLTAEGGFGNIFKINSQGDTSSFVTPFAGGAGITIDASGNLFAVSLSYVPEPTIYQFTPSGTGSVLATDSSSIFGLAVDANDNVFCANQLLRTIDKITPSGQVSVFAANIPSPSGLAFDNNGNLYATSSSNPYNDTAGVIYKFTPSGTKTTVCSGLMLSIQDGIAVDPNGNLYVSCYSPYFPTSSIVKVSPSGVATTMTTAFHIPLGIALDPSGDVFVVEVSPIGSLFGSVSKLTYH